MAGVAAGGFDEIIEFVGGGLENEVVSVEVFEFGDAETAFELADAVEAVGSVVFGGDTPEVVSSNSLLSGVAHGLDVEERGAGKLGAELGGNTVMIRGFGAVEDDEVLGEDLVLVLCGVEFDLVLGGEGGELFGEEIFGERDKVVAGGGFELDLVELVYICGIGAGGDFDMVLLGFAEGAAEALGGISEYLFLGFIEV